MDNDGRGLGFPDICLIVEETPWKKPQPGKLAQSGIEPGPLGESNNITPGTQR